MVEFACAASLEGVGQQLSEVVSTVSEDSRDSDPELFSYIAVGSPRDELLVDRFAVGVAADGARSCHGRGSPKGWGGGKWGEAPSGWTLWRVGDSVEARQAHRVPQHERRLCYDRSNSEKSGDSPSWITSTRTSGSVRLPWML